MKIKTILLKSLFFIFLTIPSFAQDTPFYANDSYTSSRTKLFKKVYIDHRQTLYCNIPFDENKNIIFPKDFDVSKISSRAKRIEIEHVVPAEEFGAYIKQWWFGDPYCVDKDNLPYKGRKCAEKTSRIFRLMLSDMYNLYPAIGAVNAMRQNYNFTQFQEDTPNSFGICEMKIQDKKAEPPAHARGIIARAYLYFEDAYRRYQMSDSQRKLMTAWDKLYPVEEWECKRTCRIEKIQGNQNDITRKRCHEINLWNCP